MQAGRAGHGAPTAFKGNPPWHFAQPVRQSCCSKDFTLAPVFKYLRFRGIQHAIVMQTKALSCKKRAAFDVRPCSRVVSVAILALCQIRQINEAVRRLNNGLEFGCFFCCGAGSSQFDSAEPLLLLKDRWGGWASRAGSKPTNSRAVNRNNGLKDKVKLLSQSAIL